MKQGSGQRDIIKPGTKHHPYGPLTKMKYGDNSVYTATYDKSYRLQQQRDRKSGVDARRTQYRWTTRDNLSRVIDKLDTSNNETFRYTAREFLRDADGPYGDLDFTYDQVGNRLTRKLASLGTTTTDTYSYPATSNRLQSVAGGQAHTFTYDAECIFVDLTQTPDTI